MRFRFGIASLLQATAIVGLLLAAFTRYHGVALQMRSFIAGVLMLTVGCIVGGICSTQRGARLGVIVLSLVFYFGLVNGIIRPFGADHVRWTYLCAATGLLLGAVYRLGAGDFAPVVERRVDDAN